MKLTCVKCDTTVNVSAADLVAAAGVCTSPRYWDRSSSQMLPCPFCQRSRGICPLVRERGTCPCWDCDAEREKTAVAFLAGLFLMNPALRAEVAHG